MPDTTFIYALLEPESDDVRYVGKADNVDRRLREHVYYCDVDKTHKGCWILSLQKQGKKPKMIVLEEVPAGQWQEAERRWIAHYQKMGARLTNIHPGGMGRPFLSYTEPTVKIEVLMPSAIAAKLDRLASGNRSAWIRARIEAAIECDKEKQLIAQVEKRRELFNQWQNTRRLAR